MRKRVKLTEGQLHKVIKESVKKCLKEENDLDGYEYESDDLVKVADKGDYTSAYIDYLKEGWDHPSDAPTLREFISMLRDGIIRYTENNNGIFYVNDWSL